MREKQDFLLLQTTTTTMTHKGSHVNVQIQSLNFILPSLCFHFWVLLRFRFVLQNPPLFFFYFPNIFPDSQTLSFSLPKCWGFDFFNDALCLFLSRLFSVLNGSWNFSVLCSLFSSQIFHCLFLVQSVWSEFSWLVELEASFTGLCFGLIVCSWCLKMGCS